jgi:hypothetical protein
MVTEFVADPRAGQGAGCAPCDANDPLAATEEKGMLEEQLPHS